MAVLTYRAPQQKPTTAMLPLRASARVIPCDRWDVRGRVGLDGLDKVFDPGTSDRLAVRNEERTERRGGLDRVRDFSRQLGLFLLLKRGGDGLLASARGQG